LIIVELACYFMNTFRLVVARFNFVIKSHQLHFLKYCHYAKERFILKTQKLAKITSSAPP